jgi:hypothetical protein
MKWLVNQAQRLILLFMEKELFQKNVQKTKMK